PEPEKVEPKKRGRKKVEVAQAEPEKVEPKKRGRKKVEVAQPEPEKVEPKKRGRKKIEVAQAEPEKAEPKKRGRKKKEATETELVNKLGTVTETVVDGEISGAEVSLEAATLQDVHSNALEELSTQNEVAVASDEDLR
ncbi:MAG TPA: hypothetical protein VHP81_03065, partial [Lachnospiraceae bacterium]|nr:hypothetical protein [Lachnospiraceae bacterium]